MKKNSNFPDDPLKDFDGVHNQRFQKLLEEVHRIQQEYGVDSSQYKKMNPIAIGHFSNTEKFHRIHEQAEKLMDLKPQRISHDEAQKKFKIIGQVHNDRIRGLRVSPYTLEYGRPGNLLSGFDNAWGKPPVALNEILRMSKELRTTLKRFEERYPRQKEMIDKLATHHWMLGSSSDDDRPYIMRINQYYSMSANELDDMYTDYFQDTDHLISEIESVTNMLIVHKSTLENICHTLKNYPESWKVLFPQVFAVIDAIILKRRNIYGEDTVLYLNKRAIEAMIDNKMIPNINTQIFQYALFRCIKEADLLWSKGYDENFYSRNTVQHGQYNPSNFTHKHFCQLILLMTTLALFNE